MENKLSPNGRQTVSVVIKGGIGNRLFQIAAAVYASVHTGRELVIRPSCVLASPHDGLDIDPFTVRSYIWMTRNIRTLTKEEDAELSKNECRVSPRLTITGMMEDLDAVQNVQHILMEGFWITAAFAEDPACEPILRAIVVVDETCLPPPAILCHALTMDPMLLPDYSNLVAVHVRRGDYLHSDFWWLFIDLTTRGSDGECYYTRAMHQFNEDTRFLIFSDDPAWCAEQSIFSGSPRNTIMPRELSALDTFGAMIKCERGIICPNSTFSWWAAYLNPSKQKLVCFPDRWTAADPDRVSGIKCVHPRWCIRIPTHTETTES